MYKVNKIMSIGILAIIGFCVFELAFFAWLAKIYLKPKPNSRELVLADVAVITFILSLLGIGIYILKFSYLGIALFIFALFLFVFTLKQDLQYSEKKIRW